jgi:hypothetical protein
VSTLKSELKQLVTHEIGVRVEDSLESAKRDLHALEGRVTAFTDGAKTVEAMLAHVDKDIEEGKMDLPTAEHAKRYLVRSVNALTNLAQQAVNYRIAQAGKVAGIEGTMVMLKNMIDSEKTKVEALLAAASAPPVENPRDRPVGVAPVSIKAQRLAEEAAPKKNGRKARASHS